MDIKTEISNSSDTGNSKAAPAKSAQSGADSVKLPFAKKNTGGSLKASLLSYLPKLSAWTSPLTTVPAQEYLDNRKIGPPSGQFVGMLGVILGLVINQMYSNYVSALGYGLGTCIVSFILAAFTYLVLSAMLSDLGTAFPFSSGCASYSFAAFGSIGTVLVGFSYLFNNTVITGANIYYSGIIFTQIFGTDPNIKGVYWIPVVAYSLALNMFPRIFFTVNFFNSILAIASLFIVSLMVSVYGQVGPAFQTYLLDGTLSNDFLPYGAMGVFMSYMWLLFMFVGFESSVVAAEEIVDVQRTLPRAQWISNILLIPLAFITMFSVAIAPEGAWSYDSKFPIIDALANVYGINTTSTEYNQLYWIVVPGLVTVIPVNIYGTSRLLYGLARGGYLPTVFALTTKAAQRTPYVAVFAIGVISVVTAIINSYGGKNVIYIVIGQVFITMLGYIADCVIYIKLSLFDIRYIDRPARSPFGVIGTGIAVILIAISLVYNIQNDPHWNKILITLVIILGSFFVIFMLVVRRNLVDTPERLFIRDKISQRTNQSSSSQSTGIDSSGASDFDSNKYSSGPSSGSGIRKGFGLRG